MACTDLGMLCTCEAEGVREAEERRLRVYQRLGVVHMERLTEAVLLSLAFDFQANADIGADMWFGVYVESPFGNVSVECDDPADGFLAAWEALADKHPFTRGPGTEVDFQIISRISAEILAWCEKVDGEHEAHRKAAHKDDNDCPPCVDCSVGRGLRATAHVTLKNAWGRETLDPAVEKSFEYRTR